MKPVLVISLGGSVICPDGLDTTLLRAYHRLLSSLIDNSKCTIILVIGGGHTARTYIAAARDLKITDSFSLDTIGIAATRTNAELILQLFKRVAYRSVCNDPTQRIRTPRSLLISGGWKPGFSTDYVAIEWARTYGATHVINLTNVDHVYTKDPKTNPDAEALVSLD